MTRILVVEDDRELSKLLADILRIEGYEVQSSSDGARALEYLAHSPNPALILLDIMMANSDGWGFLENCRRNERYRSIPVIAMSEGAVAREIVGVAATVTKPIPWAKLLALIGRHARM